MRPLEVQRREEAKNRRGGGVIFQGGDGREEAMARRSKTIPKEEPKRKAQEYYIGEQGVKRKKEATSLRGEEGRRPRPNPARGNQKLIGGKRKAIGPPDADYPQARRRPPPKPEGRLKAKGRVTFTGVRETPIPAVPGANRKPPRAASVQSGAPLPPPRKRNTKKK